ncbi:MAG: hypothetical protein KME08_08525 [Aphanothece sp. CMT-3BRIN-NPC111]|jgi:hypothetical protein|nr:hypothetical protein [Aphanothece sp. CMT-3BRIN-NPC111]
MKRAIFGATLAVLSLSLPAMAATSYKYQVKGQSANAGFYQYDECNSNSVYVYAGDNVTRNAPGAPTSQKYAEIYYSNYNFCTGVGSYSYGSSSDATFTTNQLNSANLKGTFTVNEYLPDGSSGTTKTVNVDLTWTGTGDTYRGNSHSHFQGSGYISNSRYIGAYRDSQVSGSVTADGKNLIANLSSYGSLSTSNSGSLEIIKR